MGNPVDKRLCMRFLVRGRVQGVFFRASTRRKAMDLGLCGYANNLPDGGVEVVACGQAGGLRELETWLWEGPPMARVLEVMCTELPYTERSGFETG